MLTWERPFSIPINREWLQIEGNRAYFLGLITDSSVYMGGSTVYGTRDIPAGLSRVASVGLGTDHALAVRADGRVVAWGRNHHGQTDVPPGLGRVIAVATGSQHGLVLRADGTVAAWGLNT